MGEALHGRTIKIDDSYIEFDNANQPKEKGDVPPWRVALDTRPYGSVLALQAYPIKPIVFTGTNEEKISYFLSLHILHIEPKKVSTSVDNGSKPCLR